jgi:hypothetical protein
MSSIRCALARTFVELAHSLYENAFLSFLIAFKSFLGKISIIIY